MTITIVGPGALSTPRPWSRPVGGPNVNERICSIERCGKPSRKRGWCDMHYRRWLIHGDPERPSRYEMTREDFFWSHVNKAGPIPDYAPELGPCWVWTAKLTTSGYARLKAKSEDGQAHRFAYELLVGPIPEGLQIDHLCRVRHCVNPSHLEPVTCQENLRRGINVQAAKTHCPRLHPYDEVNTRIRPDGSRHCRICELEGLRARRLAKR